MLLPQALIGHIMNTESVAFQLYDDDECAGVGTDFLVNVLRFNRDNALGLTLDVKLGKPDIDEEASDSETEGVCNFKLVFSGPGASTPLTKSGAHAILNVFSGHYRHSYSSEELLCYLRDKGVWPTE